MPIDDPAEDVAPLVVGAEEMVASSGVCSSALIVRLGGVVRGDPARRSTPETKTSRSARCRP